MDPFERTDFVEQRLYDLLALEPGHDNAIEPELYRYPALDPSRFRRSVESLQ